MRALQLSMLSRTTNLVYFGLVDRQECQAALREQGQYDPGYTAMILHNLHAITVPAPILMVIYRVELQAALRC
jgi:hypothetical protein